MLICRAIDVLLGGVLVLAAVAHAVCALAAPAAQERHGRISDWAGTGNRLPDEAIVRLGIPQKPQNYLGAPYYVAFLPDGATLFTSAPSGKHRFFDVRSGKQLRSLDGYAHVVMSPDGKTLASRKAWARGWTKDTAVELWNLTTGKKIGPIEDTRGVGGARALAFSGDGRLLAVGGGSGKSLPSDPALCVVDVANGRLVRQFPLRVQVSALALSPDGMLLATVRELGLPHVLQLWNLSTGEKQQRFNAKAVTQPVALRISPDGTLLAAAASQPCAWDLGTGKERWHIYKVDDVATDAAYTLEFSPNGQMVALGTRHGKVVLVEATTGRQRARFGGALPSVWSVAFSPCGRMVASVADDCAPLIWDITGLINRKTAPVYPVDPKDLDVYWDQLRHDDAAKAWQAILALAARPAQGVPLLNDRLAQRKAKLAAKGLGQLLASLDGDDYDIREEACRELGNLGPAVVPALEKLRANPPSLEAKRRADDLLARIAKSGLVSEEMLRRRVLETLEYIGTPGAKEVLQSEARADPASPLAQAAKGALDRIAKRLPRP